MKRLFFLLILAFTSSYIWGQTYANEYMNYGVGARSHGMGFAVTASTSGVNAAYWNPAAMNTHEGSIQVGAMHSVGFGGLVGYNQLGFVTAFGSDATSYGGITIIRQAIDDIPYTLNLLNPDGQADFEKISSFSTADYGFLLSYGGLVSDNFSLGGNVKILRRVWGSFARSLGIGLDLGLQYNTDRFRLGLVARDITTTYSNWKNSFSEDELAILLSTGNTVLKESNETALPSVLVGFAFDVISGGTFDLLLEGDVFTTFDGARNVLVSSEGSIVSIDPHVGMEMGYNRSVFLRAGIGSMQRYRSAGSTTNELDELLIQPTAGLGLYLGNIEIDYALSTIGDKQVELSHIISLSYRFGQSNSSSSGPTRNSVRSPTRRRIY